MAGRVERLAPPPVTTESLVHLRKAIVDSRREYDALRATDYGAWSAEAVVNHDIRTRAAERRLQAAMDAYDRALDRRVAQDESARKKETTDGAD